MEKLTPRQQKILTFITAQQSASLTPSMREIGQAVGLVSTSSVRDQLQNLEAAGYIRLVAGKARGIQVLRSLPVDYTAKWLELYREAGMLRPEQFDRFMFGVGLSGTDEERYKKGLAVLGMAPFEY